MVDQSDKIWKTLQQDPHRLFSPEDLAAVINPAAARKPEQRQPLVEEIKAKLQALVREGEVREAADGLFKARLFTEEGRYIEHAFLGGMGNTLFRFYSPLFRLNIGVLSVFFIRPQDAGHWLVLIKDATAGTAHCLVHWLKDGAYRIGGEAPEGEKNALRIPGRFIEPHHLNIALQDDRIQVEDQMTAKGTRVDLLTEQGLKKYRELAADYLAKTKDSLERWDPVSRGRYVMDQLLKHHQSLEVAFFGAAVDAALCQGLKG